MHLINASIGKIHDASADSFIYSKLGGIHI